MDAKRAADWSIEGIVLSIHGGRSSDTSPPPTLLLLELQKCYPKVLDRMEVFVDGGVMRGRMSLKHYVLLRRVLIGIALKNELETTMRMMGVTDLSQVHPGMSNTRAVDHLITNGEEHPYAKWRPKSEDIMDVEM
jgi:L-lactate dehydrogenase (cytochrome)